MSSKQVAITATDGDMDDVVSPLLQRIRNMWEFANLCQWIYIFGKAAKIDEALEIEDIENECLKSSSTILSDIALALLKLVSSHRGLTHEILNDQLRKEYSFRLPFQNPLGDGETNFSDLDTPTKIIALQQLTQWVMSRPERLREKMEELHDIDQTSWRIEPYGWDADDRTYYVLDDNRVYRLSEASEPPVRRPKNQKTYGANMRSGRGRQSGRSITENGAAPISSDPDSPQAKSNLGDLDWECVAVTLDDVRRLVDKFRKTRDANEKILRNQLDAHLLPILEKQEESKKRKQAQHQRELLSLAKMVNAKRSSRIAGKVEQRKEEEKARAQRDMAEKALQIEQGERLKQIKSERERDFRMFSREKRLKERAARRRLHEEELAQLSEGRDPASVGRARISGRQLQSEIDRNRLALKALDVEEEDWSFDCVCGLHGQVDDGAHSVACERCNVWQHSKCVGIEEAEADRAEFHFICVSCKRQTEKASTSRNTIIKFKARTSGKLIPHPSGDRASQVIPQPFLHPTDPSMSMNMFQVTNDPFGTPQEISQSSTRVEDSVRTNTKLFSNSNDVGGSTDEPETRHFNKQGVNGNGW
ncbi:hypothetical protein MY3957_009759 [Beauveria namnaoensis]